jgi:hypothetical protein
MSSGCTRRADRSAYNEAAKLIREPRAIPSADATSVARELVRCATLAANSHNTQPWKFHVSKARITILPDYRRRLPVVDPDDHHLFVSLGCATENLVVAAAAARLQANVSCNGESIAIELEPAAEGQRELYEAIFRRQCSRAPFDARQVSSEVLDQLVSDAVLPEGGAIALITDRKGIETLVEYVAEATRAQLTDESFKRELRQWIRFNEDEALRARDGLFAAASGNPTLPSWIAPNAFRAFFRAASEIDKATALLRASAGVAIFTTPGNQKSNWVDAGRSCERFALLATAAGLSHSFVNQPVEVPRLRSQLTSYLGIGTSRPDVMIRFGYGPRMPLSLRRSLDEVVVAR